MACASLKYYIISKEFLILSDGDGKQANNSSSVDGNEVLSARVWPVSLGISFFLKDFIRTGQPYSVNIAFH